ncbi:hypothetical protein Tco_0812091, partial [Tanacetum coccineum]
INKCLGGTPSYDSLRLSQAQILWGMYNKKNVDYAFLLWEDFIFKIKNKNSKKGNAMYYPRFTKLVVNYVMEKDPSIPRRNKVNWHYARDDPMFTIINVISRNEVAQLYGAILPVALTNEDIRNSESYKEYYAMASGTIPPKIKGSKKKADTETIPKLKPPTAPKEKRSGKGKLKSADLEKISEADLTETEQLKIITKRSRQETHISHASGSGADEGTGVIQGVPDAPDYDSEDDISWKSSDDDQDDEQAQDDEDAGKIDVNETSQDDEDDDDHDDDEQVQDDDEHDVDETTQEDDDEEQTESDDDGDDFVHPKLIAHNDDILHEEDTDEDDSSISLSDDDVCDIDVGRNECVQTTQGIEVTHVTLTTIYTGVDDIFGQHTEATSLIDTPVTAIMEPSFTAQINRPPTPLNALEDNFQNLGKQFIVAEALSSIPSIVDQYLANKMQEAVDVAVQLKYDRIREESTTANQQFLDSIDEGMKKIIKEQVLVRSSKEANTSHAVAANLSELELKKILIDKMEANNSINRTLRCAQIGGPMRRRSEKNRFYQCSTVKTTTTTAGKTTSTGSKTHKKSASQSAPVEETMQTTDVFEAPAHQEKRGLEKENEGCAYWLETISEADLCYDEDSDNEVEGTNVEGAKSDEDATYEEDQLGGPKEEGQEKNRSTSASRVNDNPDKQERTSHGPSDAMHNPLPATQSQKDFVSKLTEIHSFLLTFSLRNIRVNSFTMKMEILLESTSNKLMVEHAEYDESNTYVLERFNTSAGNPVKKILLKLNLSDHRLCKMVVEYMFQDFRYSDTTHLSRSVKVLKLKNFKKDATLKLFKNGMSMSVQKSQVHKVAKLQVGKVTSWRRDYAWLMISRCSRSLCQIQVQGTSSIQEVNDHYNIFTRERQEYELKTKDKA